MSGERGKTKGKEEERANQSNTANREHGRVRNRRDKIKR